MVRQKLAPLSLIGPALLAACGHASSHAAKPGHREVSSRATLATPTVAYQVRLAQKVGPGFLDYCPKGPGRARAYYQLDLPGEPIVKGWCQTAITRAASGDLITFAAYWDARNINRTSGTLTLTYRVPRNSLSGPSAVSAELIHQSGRLPW